LVCSSLSSFARSVTYFCMFSHSRSSTPRLNQKSLQKILTSAFLFGSWSLRFHSPANLAWSISAYSSLLKTNCVGTLTSWVLF